MPGRDRTDDRSLAAPPANQSPQWLGFHLYLQGSFDAFLTRFLAPSLDQEYAARRIRRFFFIRYSEDGPHLRLRFLPAKNGDGAWIEPWLEGMVHGFIESQPSPVDWRIDRRRYDRTEHYFGETVHSVYSELLNERTSWFGLRLLDAYGEQRAMLTLLAAACLHHFLRRSSSGSDDFRSALESSRAFAADVVAKLGGLPDLPAENEQAAFDAVFPRALDRVTALLNEDRTAQAIVALIRRTRRNGAQGKHVATHALHLFCNKVGLLMPQEHRVFCLLSRHGDTDEHLA